MSRKVSFAIEATRIAVEGYGPNEHFSREASKHFKFAKWSPAFRTSDKRDSLLMVQNLGSATHAFRLTRPYPSTAVRVNHVLKQADWLTSARDDEGLLIDGNGNTTLNRRIWMINLAGEG
jgi:hypothetical protein